jgi:hypothetical protein
MDLSFTITSGPRQRSHSQGGVPRDSLPYFALSDLRLPQPGGSGPHIYIPQKEGGSVIPPGTGLLLVLSFKVCLSYKASARTTVESTASNSYSMVAC